MRQVQETSFRLGADRISWLVVASRMTFFGINIDASYHTSQLTPQEYHDTTTITTTTRHVHQ